MYKGEKIVNAIASTDEVLLFFKKNPTITIYSVDIGNIRLLECQKNIAEYDKYMEMFQQLRSDISILQTEKGRIISNLREELQSMSGDIVKTITLQAVEQEAKRIELLTKQLEYYMNTLKSVLPQEISEQNNKLLLETLMKVKNEDKDMKTIDILQGKVDLLSTTLLTISSN